MTTIKLKPPTAPIGWSIKSDIKQKSFTPDFTLHLEPEQGEGYLKGTELLKRMQKRDDLMSAAVLDYLLEHQELIPEEWKDKSIYFWGTVYRAWNGDWNGDLYVRHLSWDGDRWYWGYYWLGGGWDGQDPALVRAKSSDTSSLESRIAALEGFQERVVELMPSLAGLEEK